MLQEQEFGASETESEGNVLSMPAAMRNRFSAEISVQDLWFMHLAAMWEQCWPRQETIIKHHRLRKRWVNRALTSSYWGCIAWVCANFAAFGQTTNYDFNLRVTGSVYTVALQPDGRILVGNIRQPSRLLTNGTVDPSFDPLPQGTCYTMGVQDDGKILIGGGFTSIGGQGGHLNLARLNADGSVDNAFGSYIERDPVFAIAFDAYGGKLIGAHLLGGQASSGIGRLNSQDVVDSSFSPTFAGSAFSLAVQSDGRILIGGWFNSLAGQPRANLARLNSDGTLDTTFYPKGLGEVECCAGQADGKILAGTSVNTSDVVITNLVRFDSNGVPDITFNPRPGGTVLSIAVQADGKIIVGGVFRGLGLQPRMGLGRINPNGTVDTTFAPIAYHTVYSLALQEDGKILVGGMLVDETGQTNSYIGRLQNTGPATQSLSYEGSTITWMRGGTSPELWRTSFQNSTDGSTWTELGEGTRISGGWQLSGVLVPAGSQIRARGRVSAGQYNGPSWFVETKLQLPQPLRILVNDSDFGFRSNEFGFNLTGPSNSLVVIESSFNLSDWIAVATNALPAGFSYFSGPPALGNFYRLRLLQ